MPFGHFRHLLAALTAAATALALTAAVAAADTPNEVDNSDFQPTSKKIGEGHEPHPGARTVKFWSGSSTNPAANQAFSFRMVGADPGSEASATIEVDIVPIDLTVAGRSFKGSDVVPAVLASPIFQTGDYSSTGDASTARGGAGPGGELSAGNVDVQLLDATMRSQFNKVGTGYHLNLSNPHVHRAVTVDVPAGAGTTLTTPAHVTFAAVIDSFMQAQVESLNAKLHFLEPHRLALFITNDALLIDHASGRCCVYGAHGVVDATAEGHGSDGRQALQTFVWSSWISPGIFNPRTKWAIQDISGFSHEITEWADDPFLSNVVQPWQSPIAPQYGCSNQLETGDPVAGIGFTQVSSGFKYHPQDEVFLPWFMRTSPNDVSQPTQSDPAAGRYTFMGDLNRIPFFHHPPGPC